MAMYMKSRINIFIFLIPLLFCFFTVGGQDDITKTRTLKKIAAITASAQNNISTKNYFKALDELKNALELAKTVDDKKSIGLINSKIGKIKYEMEEYDDAIGYLIMAVEEQRHVEDNVNLANTYKTFGYVYMNLKDYSQAQDYFKSAHVLFEKQDLNSYEAETLLAIGKACNASGKHEDAKTQLENSISLAKRNKFNKILSSAQINLGFAQFKLGDTASGIETAYSGFNIAKKNKYAEIQKEGLKVLSDLNDRAGNYKLSNNYLKQHLKLSDSLLQVKRKSLSAEQRLKLVSKTHIELQDEQVSDLESVNGDSTLDQLTTILSIALITILSLLTLSLYKNNNIRLKSNNVLHKKNSELITAKEKAEIAAKTKANFLSTVTHELRTPLYAVTGLTNMLLDENPKPEQIQHLKSLKFSGEYLLTFINDILQINKIEANKVDVEPEVFDLKKKMTNVISALKNSADDNNINLHLEYDENLPLNYNADQLKISQVLINLIGNSIKFTKDGDIWIRASKIDEKDGVYNVRFEVQDNGIGISEEKQQHMFESFSQGSIQINRKYGGTGLGLSIVKGLIEIMKGKIYLKSKLGVGSSFFFEIPMKYTDQVIKESQATYFKDVSEIELSAVKILVVEDNKINQMITKKILNKMNLNCEVVDNGEEAVDMIKNGSYDIILMDIHMPGISGIEATKIIRTFDKDLTIFALTAVTIEDRMQEFEDAGFTDIIPKPFKQEDFERKLFNALMGDKVEPKVS